LFRRSAVRFNASAAASFFVLALPQDRGAAFRGDHGVRAVLEHEKTVADTDGQRAAGTALTRNHCYDRDAQHAHLEYVTSDRFALATLLGANAGIGTLCVDECDEWQAEALGEPHETQCLAVAFGFGIP